MNDLDLMPTIPIPTSARLAVALVITVLAAATAFAQAPAPPEAKPAEAKASDAGPLAPFAWLAGCWRGVVGPREYREHWLPLRGNLLIGVSHTVAQDKTDGYEYLRLESRPEGIFYVAVPSGQKEAAFRFAERTVDQTAGRNDEMFLFVDPARDFPQKITYRRASGGWLYAVVEGKVDGKDRQLTYPMRRVDCQSGEFILN